MPTSGTRALATALLCALFLTGCTETSESGPGGTPAPTGPGEATTTGAAAPAAADNAVAPPGPLRDRLYRPDMLIFSREQLSDDMVAQVKRLKQVAAVERIGIGQ